MSMIVCVRLYFHIVYYEKLPISVEVTSPRHLIVRCFWTHRLSHPPYILLTATKTKSLDAQTKTIHPNQQCVIDLAGEFSPRSGTREPLSPSPRLPHMRLYEQVSFVRLFWAAVAVLNNGPTFTWCVVWVLDTSWIHLISLQYVWFWWARLV